MTCAYDRINTNRLTEYIRACIGGVLEQFVYEPNDALTRSMIVSALHSFCLNIKDRGSLYDYAIVCDKNNNPSSIVENNMLVCDVYIKPLHLVDTPFVNVRAIINSGSELVLKASGITKEDHYARYEYAMGVLARK
jgi:hypothetical protein